MSGNPTNAAVWGNADVLIGSLTATTPAGNAAFTMNNPPTTTTEWDYLGLLDGGQGFETGIEVESTDHEAWGYGVVATTYKGQKTTITFTALEENSVVLGLVYDTDGMTFDDTAGTYSGDLGQRDHTTRVKLALEVSSGDTIRRLITKNYATIMPTNAGTESEESLASKSFTATIFPDANGVLWTTYKGAAL